MQTLVVVGDGRKHNAAQRPKDRGHPVQIVDATRVLQANHAVQERLDLVEPKRAEHTGPCTNEHCSPRPWQHVGTASHRNSASKRRVLHIHHVELASSHQPRHNEAAEGRRRNAQQRVDNGAVACIAFVCSQSSVERRPVKPQEKRA